MKKSICHYSFHRRWKSENWTCERLANEVKTLGIKAIDFHAGYLDSVKEAPSIIKSVLDKTGLILSGLSMSNNFNQANPEELRNQINTVKKWIQVASKINAPVSRIFGGNVDRNDKDLLKQGFVKIIDALGEVVTEAEKLGVILALENHGGLPCTGEEQVAVIKKINSKYLRATIDVGNYMNCGQEAYIGTEIAADYVAYVHFKDFKKKHPENTLLPWSIEACTLGEGDVDLTKCLEALKKTGYNGFVALEYEGIEDEKTGIPKSVKHMNQVMQGF